MEPPAYERRCSLREVGWILLRGQTWPPHWRAVRAEPIVALFAEWHQQGVPETIVLTQRIAGNSDDHLVLRDFDAQRAMESVPPRKDGTKVRVVLPLVLRMVDAVHARGDEHLVE